MPRLRFSLATLLLTVLLAGSAASLYVRWGPWLVEKRWDRYEPDDQSVMMNFAAYSPDGQRIVVGGDGTMVIHDRRTFAELVRIESPDGFGWGNVGKFSPDGKHLYVIESRKLRRFDAKSGIEDKDFHPHDIYLEDVTAFPLFSPDFTNLAVNFVTGRVALFNGPGFSRVHELGLLSYNEPHAITFSNDSTLLAFSRSEGKTTRIVDVRDNRQIGSIHSHGTTVFSPAKDKMALLTDNGLELWNLKPVTPEKEWTRAREPDWPFDAQFSPDGTRILVIRDDASATIIDAARGTALFAFAPPQAQGNPMERARKTAWRPDGEQVMLGDRRGLTFFRRTRPEWWWGVFYLPELWTTGIVAGALLWKLPGKFKKPSQAIAKSNER